MEHAAHIEAVGDDEPLERTATERVLDPEGGSAGTFVGEPVVDRGTVLVGTCDDGACRRGSLCASPAACAHAGRACAPVWRSQINDGLVQYPLTVSDGMVFTTGGPSFAFDLSCPSGACRLGWRSSSSRSGMTAAARGLLFVGEDPSRIAA